MKLYKVLVPVTKPPNVQMFSFTIVIHSHYTGMRVNDNQIVKKDYYAIISNLLDFSLHILSVFKCEKEIQIYFYRLFHA
jgi:hypothetical protein